MPGVLAARASWVIRIGLAGLLAGLGLLPVGLPAWGQTGESVASEAAGDDTTYIETPLFPGVDLARGLRVQLRSRFWPNADLDPGHVDRYAPELRVRLTLPMNHRAVARVHGRIGTSRYQWSGPTPFAAVRDPLDLHEARLSLDGAYLLNQEGSSWLLEGESWSLLGLLSLQSDWEGDRFDAGLGGNLGLGFGYRIPDRFRMALGAVLRSDLDEGGIDVAPFGSFRWSITRALTLRDRGLGLLLEYRLSRRVEIFVSAFRTTDSWRLKNRLGADDLSFRDRRVQAGAGLEWRIAKYLRLNLEVGGVVDRKLRLHSDDLGTLFSQRADPTPYVDVRFELRPGKL
jgi:hypothetical protein